MMLNISLEKFTYIEIEAELWIRKSMLGLVFISPLTKKGFMVVDIVDIIVFTALIKIFFLL